MKKILFTANFLIFVALGMHACDKQPESPKNPLITLFNSFRDKCKSLKDNLFIQEPVQQNTETSTPSTSSSEPKFGMFANMPDEIIKKNSENKRPTTFVDLPDLLQTRILLEARPQLVQWLLHTKIKRLKHDGYVKCLEITPDGKKVITGTVNHRTVIWDIDTGKQIKTMNYGDKIQRILITPDSKKIIIRSSDPSISFFDGTEKIWDIDTGNLHGTLKDDNNVGCRIAMTSDSKKVIIISSETTTIICDIETGQQLSIPQGHENDLPGLAITPDDKKVITGPCNGAAIIWDIATGNKLKSLPHGDDIDHIVITPDGTMVFTGGQWKYEAIIWDIKTGKKLKSLQNDYHLACVKITPDSKKVILSTYKCVIIWDIATGKKLPLNHKGVWHLAITHDGKKVITGSSGDDKKAIIWDIETGKKLKTLQYYQSDNTSDDDIRDDIEVGSIDITPDSKTVIISTRDGSWKRDNSVTLWDIETGNLLDTLHFPKSRIEPLRMTPDGTKIIIRSEGHPYKSRAIIWTIKDDEFLENLALMSKRQLRIIKLAHEAAKKNKTLIVPDIPANQDGNSLKNDLNTLPPSIKDFILGYVKLVPYTKK